MSLLKVSGLCKAFGAVRAVDGVSLEVRAGELYGLLGPNGAGKTTTISMLAGLLKPDAGEILVRCVLRPSANPARDDLRTGTRPASPFCFSAARSWLLENSGVREPRR